MEEENFYEEMLSSRDFQSNGSKLPIILIILVMLVLIGFGGYVTYLKLTEKKEEPKQEEKEEEKVTETVQTIEFGCDDTCEYTIQVPDGTSKKEIVVKEEMKMDSDNLMHQKIMIGDVTFIDKTTACGGPGLLKVVDDILLISYHEGCDISGNSLTAYQLDGKVIKTYETFGDAEPMRITNTDFQVEGKKILVEVTRVYHGPTLQLKDGKEVNICDQTEWENYHVTEDTVATGTYEITYLGDGSFSEPTLTKKGFLKEVYQTCEIEE